MLTIQERKGGRVVIDDILKKLASGEDLAARLPYGKETTTLKFDDLAKYGRE